MQSSIFACSQQRRSYGKRADSRAGSDLFEMSKIHRARLVEIVNGLFDEASCAPLYVHGGVEALRACHHDFWDHAPDSCAEAAWRVHERQRHLVVPNAAVASLHTAL
eukprot:3930776-Pleurochrysis_carterae.AAC.1